MMMIGSMGVGLWFLGSETVRFKVHPSRVGGLQSSDPLAFSEFSDDGVISV